MDSPVAYWLPSSPLVSCLVSSSSFVACVAVPSLRASAAGGSGSPAARHRTWGTPTEIPPPPGAALRRTTTMDRLRALPCSTCRPCRPHRQCSRFGRRISLVPSWRSRLCHTPSSPHRLQRFGSPQTDPASTPPLPAARAARLPRCPCPTYLYHPPPQRLRLTCPQFPSALSLPLRAGGCPSHRRTRGATTPGPRSGAVPLLAPVKTTDPSMQRTRRTLLWRRRTRSRSLKTRSRTARPRRGPNHLRFRPSPPSRPSAVRSCLPCLTRWLSAWATRSALCTVLTTVGRPCRMLLRGRRGSSRSTACGTTGRRELHPRSWRRSGSAAAYARATPRRPAPAS